MPKHFFLLVIILGISISGFLIFNNLRKQDNQISLKQTNSFSTSQPATTTEEQKETTDFTATFEIYTNGTKRIFTDSKYHNQSADVFITASSPNTLQVKKTAITWDNFFKTLPFSLTKTCLVTGTKQTFCSTDSKKLRFFLNNVETPDALELEIKKDDFLKVVYGS